MTSIRKRKRKLILETDSIVHYRGKNRNIIIEPGPFFCSIRLKGTKVRYEVAWESVFVRGAQIAADFERNMKKRDGKQRRAR